MADKADKNVADVGPVMGRRGFLAAIGAGLGLAGLRAVIGGFGGTAGGARDRDARKTRKGNLSDVTARYWTGGDKLAG